MEVRKLKTKKLLGIYTVTDIYKRQFQLKIIGSKSLWKLENSNQLTNNILELISLIRCSENIFRIKHKWRLIQEDN